MHSTESDWLVPDWPAAPHVRALFTTRNGGVSKGAYGALNLGSHVGDAAHAVATNRQRLAATLAVRPVFLNQVHGVEVVAIDATSADGLTADAAVTTQGGVACTVMVADCLPVLLCDQSGGQVAAAHAGWRGLLGEQGQGIVERSVHRMRDGKPTEPLMAWLGPCIGPQAFEVGHEVRQAFVETNGQAEMHFVPAPGGKWLANLPALARQRLASLGVTQVYGNDGSDTWCTVAQPSRFFSHRRDKVSGRMAACIWRAV